MHFTLGIARQEPIFHLPEVSVVLGNTRRAPPPLKKNPPQAQKARHGCVRVSSNYGLIALVLYQPFINPPKKTSTQQSFCSLRLLFFFLLPFSSSIHSTPTPILSAYLFRPFLVSYLPTLHFDVFPYRGFLSPVAPPLSAPIVGLPLPPIFFLFPTSPPCCLPALNHKSIFASYSSHSTTFSTKPLLTVLSAKKLLPPPSRNCRSPLGSLRLPTVEPLFELTGPLGFPSSRRTRISYLDHYKRRNDF